MAHWIENKYDFYGLQSVAHTASHQPENSSYCWAYALGALIGVQWSEVAKHAPLDAMTYGLEFSGESNRLVESLNRTGKAQRPPWPRLLSVARWYADTWDGPTLEMKFPQVTAVDGHFLLSLAIGKQAGGPDLIRYWDPLDAQMHIVTMAEFVQNWHPKTTGSVVRAG